MIKVIYAIAKWFVHFIFRIEILGEENIPKDGPCMVCLNHISAWDPPVVVLSFKRRVRFMAKHELFKIPVVSWVLKAMDTIPLKRGASDIAAFKAALGALKNGEVLGIFPTGTRERIKKDAPVKSGAALIASKSGAPVVPVYIKADYKPFSKIKIVVGKPMVFECTEKHASQDELAQFASKIYSEILKLGDCV